MVPCEAVYWRLAEEIDGVGRLLATMRSVLLMVLFFGGVSASAFCNSNTEGSDECVLLHDYSDYQWASYLTNTYIQQKSNGRHICEYRFATYCWYQCMIETYGEESGSVYGSCSCSPGDQRDPDQDLPSECYSPDGNSCSWYRDCLERKYPCQGTEADYAVRFAEKYCNLYSNDYRSYSTNAQLWVDTVRKCLQVELVPYIRDYHQLTCPQLKEAAFDSHSPCYVDSGMCQLSCDDWLRVFWTIKGSFVEEPWESLKGMTQVAFSCVTSPSDTSLDVYLCLGAPLLGGSFLAARGVTFLLRFGIRALMRIGRSVDCDDDCIARQLMSSMAHQSNWERTTLDYFAFAN